MSFLNTADNKYGLKMGAVKGLNPAMLTKLDKSQVIATLEAAVTDNSEGNTVSTKAIAALKSELDSLEQQASSTIDDSATSGTDSTWSIDQIKDYIAEVDDTYFVSNIAERDDDSTGIVVPKREGVRVFVADASADSEVGTDSEGNPFGADYMYHSGAWNLIRAKKYKQVDVSPFIEYSEVKDNLTSTETQKPLSANQGRALNEKITTSVGSLAVAVDDTVVEDDGSGNAIINLAKVAKGEVINGMAFVVDATNGLTPVFVQTSGDGKFATIYADAPADFIGMDVRVSYMTDGTAVDAGGTDDGTSGGGSGDGASI